VHAAAHFAAGWASADGSHGPYLDHKPIVVTRKILDDESGRHEF
jgi:hypothetical protein